MYIDTHSHLYWDSLIPRIDEILLDAKNAWVEKMICIWCNIEDAAKSKNLAEKYDNINFTVWIHPTDIKWLVNWDKFEEFLSHPKCIAVGECWFDLFHSKDDFEDQKAMFIKQIEISKKHNKPLVIHTRNAWTQVLEYLESTNWNFVIHCFTEDKEFASRVQDMWWYLWIWWILTYPKAEQIRTAIKDFPLEKILLETDCPFLAPQSVRWQINEPKYIPEIALKVSEIKWISVDEVEKVTTENAERLFWLL